MDRREPLRHPVSCHISHYYLITKGIIIKGSGTIEKARNLPKSLIDCMHCGDGLRDCHQVGCCGSPVPWTGAQVHSTHGFGHRWRRP